jgi:malate dehydrogenase
MFNRIATTARAASRGFSSTSAAASKVAVLGAAGGIGQPLSLLLKGNPRISHLSLYDIVGTPGVAADLGHINHPCQVTGHVGDDELGDALADCDMVVIPAGVPRKPGMTRDDLFNTNAGIVKTLIEGVAEHCPDAFVCIISNPVNSTVPIAAEILKKAGVYDKAKLFGVTTLDVCRANTFVAENQGWDPRDTNVTVVGGHAGTTILPLLSQVRGARFTPDEAEALTHRIQFGGDEVVQAKDGAGSATLSMAYAGAFFARRLLDAASGESDVVECTYVESDVADTTFFSTRVTLGPEGVKEVHGFGPLNELEQQNYDEMVKDLEGQIQKGVDFVNK